jgi:hypothetical protein
MNIVDLYNKENDSEQEKFHSLRKEYRYLIIIQVEQDGKKYSSSNVTPISDIKLAKEIAIKNFKVNLKNKANIIIRGFKYLFADVPISNIITGTKYEMQCISCKSLSEEEIIKLNS